MSAPEQTPPRQQEPATIKGPPSIKERRRRISQERNPKRHRPRKRLQWSKCPPGLVDPSTVPSTKEEGLEDSFWWQM
jgi:hypothetical protein